MVKNHPTFLGIGAQRAGTSWLYSQLNQHPQIWMPPVKELHFFDRSTTYPSPNDLASKTLATRILGTQPWQRRRTISHIRTISSHIRKRNYSEALWWIKWTFGHYNDNWYKSLFTNATGNVVSGEITPSYSILKHYDIQQIKAINADIKLLFMIRNPIERAWSAIRYHAFTGYAVDLNSPEQIISLLELPAMHLRSDYERTLNAYLSHFSNKQILICFYDAIRHDPSGLLNSISSFLNVASFNPTAINSKNLVNQSPSHPIPLKVQKYLQDKYSPLINRLSQRFGSYTSFWSSNGLVNDTADRNKDTSRLLPTLHP